MFIFNANKQAVATAVTTSTATVAVPATIAGKALSVTSKALSGAISTGSALISLGTRLLLWGTALSLGLRLTRSAFMFLGRGSSAPSEELPA